MWAQPLCDVDCAVLAVVCVGLGSTLISSFGHSSFNAVGFWWSGRDVPGLQAAHYAALNVLVPAWTGEQPGDEYVRGVTGFMVAFKREAQN